jgi:HPt (histidine-containing phosphotransfer) domain-containing protein
MQLKTISAVSAALAGLDLTAENDEIIAIEAKISELVAAIERAQARRTEIAHQLIGNDKPDAKAIADAVLAGDTAAAVSAGPSREALIGEKDALHEAVRELTWREEDARAELKQAQARALTKAREAVEPLIDELMDRAREVIAELPELYAALIAITDATRAGADGANRLRDAVKGTHGDGKLGQWTRSMMVPAEITAALRPLASKGPAMGAARFSHSVGMP